MLLEKSESCLLLIDVQEKLTPYVLNSERLVERCEWLMRLAYDMDVPTLVSEQYPQGLGHTVEPLRGLVKEQNCISKVHFSGFAEPAFINMWQEIQKQQAVLAGIETHVCVLQTAIEMRQAGLEVFVVVDAVSSRQEMDHRFGLKRMKQQGIHLITAEMVFFEWMRKAGTAVFKTLSQTYLPRSRHESK